MGILVVLGAIIVYYICYLYFSADKANSSISNKEAAIKRGDLSYYDYNAKSDRMVSSGEKVRRLMSHDREGRMFYYYLDKRSGSFVDAQYFGTKEQDKPIKYRDVDIQHWLNSGVIKSESELYKRW